MTKLRLPDVTLCVADCLHPGLAARALKKCIELADFGDAILFSDQRIDGPFRWAPIDALKSSNDYSRFCLREMAAHIATPFTLVVQWDGYLVDPSAWTRLFLDYDYIGAPWTTGVVGNGGFSLRSRRLLEAVKAVPALPGWAEDWIICVLFREKLEKEHGIRFAPRALASRFSYEELAPPKKCLGFHGVFNLRHYESDDDLVRIASVLGPSECASWPYLSLIFDCDHAGRREVALELYAQARRDLSVERLAAMASAKSGRIKPETLVSGILYMEARLKARSGTVAS